VEQLSHRFRGAEQKEDEFNISFVSFIALVYVPAFLVSSIHCARVVKQRLSCLKLENLFSRTEMLSLSFAST
jgi:hypothetical protein